MNEVIMKTLTCPLLALAKVEEKSDAPVTDTLALRALDLRARIMCRIIWREKKNALPSPIFFSASLIISPLASAQAGIMLEHEVMQ